MQPATPQSGTIGDRSDGGVPVSSQIDLLRARRFMPLFAMQATGAFNDNLFKSAFVMLVTVRRRRCIPRSTPARCRRSPAAR